MMAQNSSHSSDMVGSIHTDNSRIRNPNSQFRPKSERQNAARERKPIHLPPMQLREAFSYNFPFLFVVSRGNGKTLLRISSTLLRMCASLYDIIGCGRSRGCQKKSKNGVTEIVDVIGPHKLAVWQSDAILARFGAAGEQSGLLTRIATGSASLFVRMKS